MAFNYAAREPDPARPGAAGSTFLSCEMNFDF